MVRTARSCCSPSPARKKKNEPAIPEPIRADLDRIGGIETLAARLPDDEALGAAGRVHHALSDPLRLTILHLVRDQPLCVCVIREFVRIADSRLSYHLTILKEAGLIAGEYHGNWIIYSITDTGRRLLACTGHAGSGRT